MERIEQIPVSLANDPPSVSLHQARTLESEKKRLRKATQEMESFFLYYMIRAMRKTIPEPDDKGGVSLGGGPGRDIYTQMFDQELATKMAGLSERSMAGILFHSMERVLEKQYPESLPENASEVKSIPLRKYISIRHESSELPLRNRDLEQKNPTPDRLSRFEHAISEASAKYRLDPHLIKSIIKVESDGDPGAVSPIGAKGLMQLTDTTAMAMGVEDAFDPAQNIDGGAKYLRHLIDRFQNIKKALAAFNAGPEAVKQYGGIPPYPETEQYVQKVLSEVQGHDLFY
jgi:Rod binding domain-containing protein